MTAGVRWLVGYLALAAALPAVVSAAETPAERGKRVVYEGLAALGGDAFLRMNDRVEAGRAYSFYRSQINGLSVAKIYTRYAPPAPGAPAVRGVPRECAPRPTPAWGHGRPRRPCRRSR